MEIPNFVNTPIADKEGNLTPEWHNLFSQLITELQLNLSNEGFKLPSLSTAEINQLGLTLGGIDNAPKTRGYMVYDTTTDQMKVFINNAWKVVTVT